MRSNGSVQDVRLPLADGQPIQFLTTRDTHDPDALYVLRHSSAHLLAEAVRRLYPGVKVAIGPPIEHGFYYDFEFPEPISEADLERIEAEVRARDRRGASLDPRGDLPRRGAQALRGRGRAVQGRARRHGRGRHLAVHARASSPTSAAGPTSRTPQPIKAFKLTGLAGAYWRGDEHNTQLTRIYGTAFFRPGRSRRAPRAARGGAQARPPPARRRSSTCSTSPTSRRARRSGTRRGW